MALGHTPYGRGDVKLQWELKPLETPFDRTNLGETSWMDTGTAGHAFNELVGGLALDTGYHWRIRLLYHPSNTPYQPYSRWVDGGTFITALSGEQNITGTGEIPLLGSSASVNLTAQGTLSSITLLSYPFTANPHEDTGALGTTMLNRYFSLEPNTGAEGFDMTLCLNYLDADVAEAGVIESTLRLCYWTGDDWSCLPRSEDSSTIENLVCADHITHLSEWTMEGQTPTSSPLSMLNAIQEGSRVTLQWETASETNLLGFNLYREPAGGGQRIKLNSTIVPPQNLGGMTGAIYTYTDNLERPVDRYVYWLEVVSVLGSDLLGPLSPDLRFRLYFPYIYLTP